MSDHPSLDADFWPVFGRALGRPVAPGSYTTAQLPEWDSLRHVELIFELEDSFRIQIPSEAIADLFSDTNTVLAFLRAKLAPAQ